MMLKRRSYTAVGVISLFSLLVMFSAISRQFNDMTLKRPRQNYLGTQQVMTAIDATEGTVLNEEEVVPVQSHSKIVDQSSYTCETNTSADFDTSGNPCINMDKVVARQSIYAVDTSDVAYVYCSIPKNGCTYHLGVMHRLLGFDYEGGGSVHSSLNKGRLQVSPKALQRMLLDPGVEKYMVVRNPLQRVLSAYFDKVERYMPANNRTPKAFQEWAYEQLEPGMDERNNVNPHWKPQIAFCGFSMRNLWKRFRWFTVEEPAEYVDYLEDLLPQWVTKDGWDGSDNNSFRQSVLGPRKRTGNTTERFFQYVPTLKLFDYLTEVYKLDVEGLGYEKEVADMRKELLTRINNKQEGDVDVETSR